VSGRGAVKLLVLGSAIADVRDLDNILQSFYIASLGSTATGFVESRKRKVGTYLVSFLYSN
jgi:hypothetical protein